jgi:hypothetical protein
MALKNEQNRVSGDSVNAHGMVWDFKAGEASCLLHLAFMTDRQWILLPFAWSEFILP